MILHAGMSGINTGRFGWVYGQTNAELMSLTYGGSLGLGVQSPDNTLHVVGTSTVTSNAFVGGDLTVAGSINGTINFPAILAGTNLHNTSGISTFNNVNAVKIGINQANPVKELDCFSGTGLFASVGIGTTNPINAVTIKGSIGIQSTGCAIGIGTTAILVGSGVNYGTVQLHHQDMTVWNGSIAVVGGGTFDGIGFGTFSPRCAADFSDVTGNQFPFMLPPKITTATRNGMSGAFAGAVIYNTTDNKLQVYNGSAWQNCN